jgi:hypothetical protein
VRVERRLIGPFLDEREVRRVCTVLETIVYETPCLASGRLHVAGQYIAYGIDVFGIRADMSDNMESGGGHTRDYIRLRPGSRAVAIILLGTDGSCVCHEAYGPATHNFRMHST